MLTNIYSYLEQFTPVCFLSVCVWNPPCVVYPRWSLMFTWQSWQRSERVRSTLYLWTWREGGWWWWRRWRTIRRTGPLLLMTKVIITHSHTINAQNTTNIPVGVFCPHNRSKSFKDGDIVSVESQSSSCVPSLYTYLWKFLSQSLKLFFFSSSHHSLTHSLVYPSLPVRQLIKSQRVQNKLGIVFEKEKDKSQRKDFIFASAKARTHIITQVLSKALFS